MTAILGATAIGGIAGYVVTWLVFRQSGPAAYATFMVFWSSLYLVVGALAGIQQEITRATHRIPRGSRPGASKVRNFGLVTASGVFLLVLASAPLWVTRVFPDSGWSLVFPLAIAAGSYVLVATLSGTLYGISRWNSLAWMVTFDALLRLCFIGFGTLLGVDVVVLAWCVALPIPLSLALWYSYRKDVIGVTDIDVGYRSLSWNIARTLLASAASALMVSGFPVLLELNSAGVERALLGSLIFAITLTRAPLIIVAMSVQSYLLVRFRDFPDRFWRTLWGTLGLVAACGVVVAALGWWLGPWAYALVAGELFPLDGSFIAILVGSSALVAAMFITGPAVLSRSQHLVYSLSWGIAAIATVAPLALPLDFVLRLELALTVGPLTGLTFTLVYLVGARPTSVRVEPAEKLQP